MKIAMILPSLANKGPVIVAKDLCEQFIRKGHDCKVYYLDDNVQLQMPCPVERISFWQSIDFTQWDVIHSHMFRPDGYVWYHLRMRHIPTSVKLVTTLHQPITFVALRLNYNYLRSFITHLLWARFITAFDNVVMLNDFTAKSMNRQFPRLNLSVVHNGRDIATGHISTDISQITDLKNKYRIIGTCSNITRRKGLSQMVKALQFLPDYAFVAVGDGEQLQELQQLAARLGVQDRCVWLGYRANATDYLSLFDLFVMCTYSEGFPLALIEAAAYGLPTVLSDIPILKSIISEPDVSFYHLDNISDLVSKIEHVYRHRTEYGRNIRQRYEQEMTASVMSENYLKIYG